MPANLVSVLQYGVLGLCAYMIWHVGKTISAEQKRSGQPRPGILTAAYVFMCFCVVMGGLNAFVQLQEKAILSQSKASALDEGKNNDIIFQLRGVIIGHEKKLGEQAQAFDTKLKDASIEIAQYKQKIDQLTERTLVSERALSDGQQILARVQREYRELDAKATAWKDDRAAMAAELARANETVARRNLVISTIAAKFEPLWKASKANADTETTLVVISGIVTGVGGDLKAFKRQEGANIDMPPFEVAEKEAPVVTAVASLGYSVEHVATVGGTYVDKLTGATLSIHDMSWSLSGTRLFGRVSFPDGKTESIFAGDPGMSWNYTWNSRKFVISVSLGDKRKTFKVNVQETTETAVPATRGESVVIRGKAN